MAHVGSSAEEIRRLTLRYKDYRDGDKQKMMHLAGEEFVRRLLMHFLPQGLMRIRHYGFLANRMRETKLARIREALAAPTTAPEANDSGHGTTEPRYPCTQCKQGQMRVVGEILPRRSVLVPPFR